MESPKSLWIWGFLLLGFACISFSLYYSQKTHPPLSPTVTLALAERLTGSASLLRNGMVQKENLSRKMAVGHLDSLETGELGEVILDFETADRIRLKEHTLVTLERVEDPEGFHSILVLKRGHIQVENTGREGELFIAKNGERISASKYQDSPLAQAPVQEAEANEIPATQVPEGASLNEKEIQDVMGSRRSSFMKCYTQLLQKDAKAKGEVSLAFTVENSGKVGAVEMTSTNLQQDDFKKCLVDVVSRVEFPPFKGAPVSTLFPLKFE